MAVGELATTTQVSQTLLMLPAPQVCLKRVAVEAEDALVGQVSYSLNMRQQSRTQLLMTQTLQHLAQCHQMDRIQRVVLHIRFLQTLERWSALVTASLVGTLWLMDQERHM
jgi:hypothetical protein